MGPNDLNTLHQAGVLATKQGDWGSLRYQIQDLEQAVARSGQPDQMRRVYHLQGELAIAQGNPKKAHELLEKANGLFPHPLYQTPLPALTSPRRIWSTPRQLIERSSSLQIRGSTYPFTT